MKLDMPRFLALLSGDTLEMAKAEFLANLARGGGRATVIGQRGRLLRVNVKFLGKTDRGLVERKIFDELALTHEVTSFIGDWSVVEKLSWRELFPRGGVAVQAMKLPPKLERSGREYARKLGDIFSRQHIKVDMASKNVVRIYVLPEAVLLGVLLWQNPREFGKRRPHLRPFVSPIAMHPKFARAMVNLARVKRGQKVLDPFCGTGGILIEVGLLGARIFGCDFFPKMVAGTKKNLKHFKLKGRVKVGDALKAAGLFRRDLPFDAVVTELPFGRASRLTMEKTRLRREFVARLPNIVRRGGFAVLSLDTEKIETPRPFTSEGVFPIFVHGQLTRFVHVWRKPAL